MDRKNTTQKGNLMCTMKKSGMIAFEPEVSREDGDILDVSAAGMQTDDCRINQVSTDLLIECDIMRYSAVVRRDVISVEGLLDILEQAQRIINRGIYNTMTLASSYTGTIRKSDGKQLVVSIETNASQQFSLLF